MKTPLELQQTISVANSGVSKVANSDVSKEVQTEKFLRGLLKDLGVIYILIALMKLSLGVILMYVFLSLYGPEPISVYIGYQMWESVMFIVSGSLSIAAGNRDEACLDQGSLGLNIISSVMATVGIIFSLNISSFNYLPCDYTHMADTCAVNKFLIAAMNGLVFTLSVLEFCIAVSLSACEFLLICVNSFESVISMPSSPHMAETEPTASFSEDSVPPAE